MKFSKQSPPCLVLLGIILLPLALSVDPIIDPPGDNISDSTLNATNILEEEENLEIITIEPESQHQLDIDNDVEKLLTERLRLKESTNSSYADKKTKEKLSKFSNQTQADILKVMMLEQKYKEKAIAYGASENLNVFKYLILDNGDLDTYTSYGLTALHVAAIHNNIEVIKFLTNRENIDLNVKDEQYRRTALNWAAFHNNVEVIQILTQNPSTIINSKDLFGHNALHLASYKGHLNTVEWLVKHGNVSVYSKDKSRNRPLDLAAYEGHLNVIKFLFENGAKINVRNSNNNTAIHRAAFKNRLNVLQYLIENGGYINLKNKWGYSPLHYAAEKGFHEEVKYLLENNKTKAHVHIKNKKGSTPLHVTAAPQIDFYQFLEVVNKLFEVGIESTDDTGNNLIISYLALILGLSKVPDDMVFILDHYEEPDFKKSVNSDREAKTLFAKYGLENNVNTQRSVNNPKPNSKYFSKLLGIKKSNLFKSAGQEHRKVDFETFQYEYLQNKSSEHVKVAKYLIENGNANINAKDKKGNTPIIMSILFENVTKYLLESGADINSQNYKNNTLLHTLANEHEDLENPNYVKWVVLYNETNVNIQNIYGNTPLHIAAKKGYFDFVKILYKNKNIKSNIKNKYGRTPLHEAAASGNENIVEWISERNNNVVKIKDNLGNTALHVAAEHDKVSVVEWLIEEGDAEMSVRNKQGQTPVKIAKIHSAGKVTQYFNDNYF